MMTNLQSNVPEQRIRAANARPPRPEGVRVVYWMIASRRVRFNFALQRAAEWARHLGRPLLILEALRSDYPWASDRLHRFIIDGMADTAAALKRRNVTYLPYVEPENGAGKGLLEALAADGAVVVTDDFPAFFLPAMVSAAAEKIPVRLEAVDSNGLLPMATADRDFATAYSFRRFLQKELLVHVADMPLEDPLAEALPLPSPLPADTARTWPAVTAGLLAGDRNALAGLPIDHSVDVVPTRGGSSAAARRMISSTIASIGIAQSATDPRPRPPAVCRPTFISATSRRTRSSSRPCGASAGRRRTSCRRPTAGAPGGGVWERMQRPSSTS
jgi:deoxyribodipyrimidine photo-lyase